MMNVAPAPINEQERLKALSEYFILDTSPEDDFDDITTIASEICDTPISFVSIIGSDRQWFKSSFGLSISETPRANAVCAHTIGTPNEILIVSDLTKDKRFKNNPLVTGKPHAVFYAGVPLVNPDGYALGTLCVIDTKPRKLKDKQVRILQSLANQVVSLLELRKKVQQLKQKQAELDSAYGDLEKIAHIASHDLKSPLNNIISLTHLLKDDYSKTLDAEGNEYITFLNEAAYRLSDLVSGIVIYSRATQIVVQDKEDVNVSLLIEEVITALNIPKNATVKYKKNNDSIKAPRSVIKQILTQLIQNAILFNESSKIKVDVKFHENKHAYSFEIKDNGPGIADDDKDLIFNLFERLHKKIKDGESMGIGLAIVKRLIEKCGGEIKVDSEPGKGSTFVFTIPKQ